ncbi:peptidase [bacterium]|nr:peptidase [bacterium]
MKKAFLLTGLLLLGGCSALRFTSPETEPGITYQIDLTNHTDDLFHVTVLTENLSKDNNIYQFAATAPGTYEVMDFGRFVQSFKAFDADGQEIEVINLSTNQWQIARPQQLKKIEYILEDTYDSEIEEAAIAPMSGTGIEDDVIVLNTFGVLGYFKGLQTHPVRIKVNHQPDWTLGTALQKDQTGYYFADTYDRLADSPMLVGDLTIDSTLVNGIAVKIYLYSPDDKYNATQIIKVADDILQSAGQFIGYDPVPNYEFLFCLMSREQITRNQFRGFGALEHSYSSLYVMPTPRENVQELSNMIAHEFMHILTPLNLHSEIIHEYNFAEPTADEHTWLYEGVTEWASQIMQLRSGLINTDRYMRRISGKMNRAERIGSMFPDYSLCQMSTEAFTPKGDRAFVNFYQLGALTAGLLDIRLLELSGGKRGLRDIFVELLDEYGKSKPFPKDNFFQIFTEKTYPEIEQFINDYIIGTKVLPLDTYYAKLGFKYLPERLSDRSRPTLDAEMGGRAAGVFLFENVRSRAEEYGLRNGDILTHLFGEKVTPENVRELGPKLFGMALDTPFEMIVERDGEEITLQAQVFQAKDYHVFEEVETLSMQQKTLREAWVKNL